MMITSLGSIFIARLYTPRDVGSLVVLMSIVGWVSYASTLRLDQAILADRDDKDVVATFYAAVVATLFVALATAIVGGVLWASVLGLLKAPGLENYFIVVVLCVTAAGVRSTLHAWTVRRGLFALQVRTSLASSLAHPLVTIPLGLFQAGLPGLVAGYVTGNLVGLLSIVRAVYLTEDMKCKAQTVLGAVKRNQAFITLGLPQTLLNGVFVYGSPLWIASLFGPETTGQYSMAYKVIVFPFSVLSGPISALFKNEISSAIRRRRKLWATLWRTGQKLVVLVSLPVLLVGGSAPLWMPPVFGEAWSDAGKMTLWLAPMVAISMVVSPMCSSLDIIRRQGLLLVMDVLRIAGIGGWYSWCKVSAATWSAGIQAFVVVCALVYGLWGVIVYRAVKCYDRSMNAMS